MGRTTELRRALKERFFPHASARGFVVDDRQQPRSTVFRRRNGARLELFELQWDKYGTPRFVLHFGTCSAEGLRVDDVLFPPGETLPTWCPDRGTLKPRRGTSTRSWFRQDSTWGQRLVGRPPVRDAAAVVDQLLNLFPEVERYWSSGEIGPHVKIWSGPARAAGVRQIKRGGGI